MSIKDAIRNLSAVIGLTAASGLTLGAAELLSSARDSVDSFNRDNTENTTVLYGLSDRFIPVKASDGSFDEAASKSIISRLNLHKTLPHFRQFCRQVEFELAKTTPDQAKMYDSYNTLLDSVFGRDSSEKKDLLPYANSMIDFVKEGYDNFTSSAQGGLLAVIIGCALGASVPFVRRSKKKTDNSAALPPEVKAAMLAIGSVVCVSLGFGGMAISPVDKASNLGATEIEKAFVEAQREIYNDYHFNEDGSQKTHTDTPKIYRFVDNSR